jgi:hypothetical protein
MYSCMHDHEIYTVAALVRYAPLDTVVSIFRNKVFGFVHQIVRTCLRARRRNLLAELVPCVISWRKVPAKLVVPVALMVPPLHWNDEVRGMIRRAVGWHRVA